MDATTKQTVYIVDDEPGIRKVLTDELQSLGCKVNCFADAASCLDVLPDNDCNLIITDVKMPGMDGLALLARAKHIAPWVSVIVITGCGDIQMAVKALKLGAADFVEKPLDRDSFLQKVKSILKQNDFAGSSAHSSLTKTEKKVLQSIIDGKSNKEIAYKMGRSVRTIEFHRSNIMHKFEADSLVELVKKAIGINFTD